MQFVFSILLSFTFGLFMLQCQSSEKVKTETAKNAATNSAAATNSNAAANVKTNSQTAHADEHSDDAPRISVEDAKKAFDAGDVVIVDTRAEVAYKNEHIKGAINIPAETFQTRYKEVPKGKKIIAYCS